MAATPPHGLPTGTLIDYRQRIIPPRKVCLMQNFTHTAVLAFSMVFLRQKSLSNEPQLWAWQEWV
jgi:hypothetical protein